MANIPEDDRDELLLSCRYGDLEDIQAFVDRHGASSLAEIRDHNQNTVLHMASANGHLGMASFTRLESIEVGELIMGRWADVLKYLLPLVPPSLLSAQNTAGSTPLHWAAVNAHLEIAKALIEFPDGPGVNLIDIKNEAGHSPLAEAEYAGWDEGAKYLVGVMNLDAEKADKEEGEGDAVLEEGQEIEVQIEDAEGQIAKMKIGGSESPSKPQSSPPSA